MTTATAKRRPQTRTKQMTLGGYVIAWMERFLVFSEGDYFGQPFRLEPWQKDFIRECYRLRPNGSRQYDRALLGLPKGNGKTEVAAGVSLAELAGPVVFNGWNPDGTLRQPLRRTAPDIPVAAASYDQADTLFGSAKTMVKEGPLAPYFEVYDQEILPKSGPGTLYRVPAVAGTNDGARPTFFAADEVHEWEGKKARVHLVLSNGRAKREDAWELSISTAGWDSESLLARMYQHGKAVAAGTAQDDRFLMRWYEAPDDLNLEDEDELRKAIRAANPATGSFLSEENIVQRYHQIPEHEFRRYYLNQWTSVPEQWITPEMWAEAASPREVPPGTPIAVGFDGSYNRDSTALIGCTLEDTPYLFTIAVWERPPGKDEWTVEKGEVEAMILEVCETWDVRSIPCDDTFGRIWSGILEGLALKGIPVIEWPTRSPSRMAPACAQFWAAINDGSLTHDDHPKLTEHFMNCRTKTDRWGPRIVKEHRNSEKKIDGAVAAVISHDMVLRDDGSGESVYEERGLTLLG